MGFKKAEETKNYEIVDLLKKIPGCEGVTADDVEIVALVKEKK